MKKRLFALTLMLVLLIGNISAYASCKVVSIMYHDITEDSSRWGAYCISPEQLESDISYFLSNGYISITASELANEDMNNLNGRKILLLTFDDGYSGWYTYAMPILKKYGAKASMYMIGSKINHYGYLSSYQIREMANCGLIEIGNHTDKVHQASLDLVKQLYNDPYASKDIVSDIKNSAAKIQEASGKSVTSITWPYGYYTDALDAEVKNAGYKISFSTNYGVNVYKGSTAVPFNRINREDTTTSADLYARAENLFNR